MACPQRGLSLLWPAPGVAYPLWGLPLAWPALVRACLLFDFQLFRHKSLFQFFFCRDEGIVIAVTIWQWIAELVVTILGGIISVNHGENRIVDHFMLFSIIWIVHVVLPAFFLLADSQFRRSLQEKGFIRAIIEALTQEYQWKC